MRIGVISDTHIPGRAHSLPRRVFEVFEEVDLILHAGDFVTPAVLEELSTVAETRGVAGNIDDSSIHDSLPETVVIDLDGIRVGMVHDSGLSKGRRQRMISKFPGCRVVVFGHSHQPLLEDEQGLMLLNPGSACDPRSAKTATVALLTIRDAHPEAELIEL